MELVRSEKMVGLDLPLKEVPSLFALKMDFDRWVSAINRFTPSFFMQLGTSNGRKNSNQDQEKHPLSLFPIACTSVWATSSMPGTRVRERERRGGYPPQFPSDVQDARSFHTNEVTSNGLQPTSVGNSILQLLRKK